MDKLSRILSSLALAIVGTLLFSPFASAQSSFSAADIASAPDCQRFPIGQEGYLCNCPAGFQLGSVWGSGPYTADSHICTAAGHAGAISPDGGVVFAVAQQGQSSYAGSVSNGVSTSNWGAYGDSFVFQTAQPSSFLAACSTMPSGEDSLTCSCGSDTGSDGSVWGSGPYTADSSICAAARHAGYLDSGPGTVSVLRIQGLESYGASVWNGVTTSAWGDYGSSIIFNGN